MIRPTAICRDIIAWWRAGRGVDHEPVPPIPNKPRCFEVPGSDRLRALPRRVNLNGHRHADIEDALTAA